VSDVLLQGLNEPQRQAVLANDGPVLVLAGAGSGKTRALTRKIAWLVAQEGLAPWQILAVTFTNRAAREMRERVASLLGEQADDVWLSTFHGLGARLLRRHGDLIGVDRRFTIYDADDQKAMVKRCMRELDLSTDRVKPPVVAHYIQQAKLAAQLPDHPELPRGSGIDKLAARVYALYEQRMREAGAVDFSDLILLPLRLFQQFPVVASEYKHRWRFVLVDEFQDTNRVQYDLLRALLNDDRCLCVVGDDDQSIYGWRGADVRNILEFERDFPGARVVRLEQNYRSSDAILRVSGALIEQNRGRHGKRLWTERRGGEPVRVHAAADDRAEAEWVARRVQALRASYRLGEMAVFYRTNAQSRGFEDALRRQRIPYELVGGTRFYERAEVKDVLAYLRVLVNPADAVSLERIINVPSRKIGATTLQRLRDRAWDQGVSLWEAARQLATQGTPAMRKKLGPFVALIESLQALALDEDHPAPAFTVAASVLERTGYLKTVEANDKAKNEARAENIAELMNAIEEHGERTGDTSLQGFLEQVTLDGDIDRADLGSTAAGRAADGRVALMTAHTAKGLEFDVVFVTGFEEGLFPHANSADSTDRVEEERRLAYVAMTRARHVLHVSYARERRRFGQLDFAFPSPFLDALTGDVAKLIVRTGVPDRPGRWGGPRLSWSDEEFVSGQASGFGGGAAASPPSRAWAGRASPPQVAPDPFPAYEDESQEAPLGIGSAVFHPQFGEGRIVSFTGRGAKAICQVVFPDGAKRRIVARFLTPA